MAIDAGVGPVAYEPQSTSPPSAHVPGVDSDSDGLAGSDGVSSEGDGAGSFQYSMDGYSPSYMPEGEVPEVLEDIEVEVEAAAVEEAFAVHVEVPNVETASVSMADVVEGHEAEPQHDPGRVASKRASSTRLNTSPDVLLALSPLPHCVIGLDHNAHRWVAKWRAHLTFPEWRGTVAQKSFSKVFTRETWRTSLEAVHANTWSKWEMVAGHLPLEGGEPQAPGLIPDWAIAALEDEVLALQPRKKYG